MQGEGTGDHQRITAVSAIVILVNRKLVKMPRSDDNIVYLNVCQYVTWAHEIKLIEDISGTKNNIYIYIFFSFFLYYIYIFNEACLVTVG